MSESQADRPAARLVEGADQETASALVRRGPGRRPAASRLPGPARHAADRIALGYNAVDNDYFAGAATFWRQIPKRPRGLAACSLFSRRLPVRPREEPGPPDRGICALSRSVRPQTAWDLVLCGDGPGAAGLEQAIASSGCADCDPPPGLSPGRALAALVRSRRRVRAAESYRALGPGRQRGRRERPAAAGLTRAGCAATLVPEPAGTTGGRFDPLDIERNDGKLAWMATLRPRNATRWASGRRRPFRTGAPTGSPKACWKLSTSPERHDRRRAIAVFIVESRKRDETMTRAQVASQHRPLRTRRRLAPATSIPRANAGWLHLCNGLDPVRDGGMVPSILGMTGALAGCAVT